MDVSVRHHYYPSLCYWGLNQAGFNRDGFVRYEEWARELSALGDAFAFAPPSAGGPMFSLLYQIPSYLDPQDPSELPKITEGLKHFIRTGKMEFFLHQWPEGTRHWEQWFTEPCVEYILRGMGEDREGACALTERFFEYMDFLWPQYASRFARSTEDSALDDRLGRLDPRIAECWEDLLGVGYPYDAFSLIICPESPTAASSLGPEKVVFGQDHSLDMMEHAFVHEVGVRTIGLHRLAEHPATAELMMDDYVAMLKLIEAEVCYHKPHVLPGLERDLFLEGMGLGSLVEDRAQMTESRRQLDLPEFFALWFKDARHRGRF